jgi:hypothetical protein
MQHPNVIQVHHQKVFNKTLRLDQIILPGIQSQRLDK